MRDTPLRILLADDHVTVRHGLKLLIDSQPDMEVIALHVSAIARAAYAEDEAIRMGDMVAKELATLVSHKLAETKDAMGD